VIIELLQRLRLAAAGMGQHLLPEHLKLVADSVTYCGEVMGATFPGFKALCTSTSISTPFTKAAFQVCFIYENQADFGRPTLM